MLKGEVAGSQIVVEHPICWDTIVVDGYLPQLSSSLFKKGNELLLFLQPGSSDPDRSFLPPFKLAYQDTDGNCGAVIADDEAAQKIIRDARLTPPK